MNKRIGLWERLKHEYNHSGKYKSKEKIYPVSITDSQANRLENIEKKKDISNFKKRIEESKFKIPKILYQMTKIRGYRKAST